MLSTESTQTKNQAKALYESTLRKVLERNHHGEFVCIEPISGEYFLGRTLDEAINQAIDAHPGKLTHTLRVGYDAALHLGVIVQ